jgi:hypothetical protein
LESRKGASTDRAGQPFKIRDLRRFVKVCPRPKRMATINRRDSETHPTLTVIYVTANRSAIFPARKEKAQTLTTCADPNHPNISQYVWFRREEWTFVSGHRASYDHEAGTIKQTQVENRFSSATCINQHLSTLSKQNEYSVMQWTDGNSKYFIGNCCPCGRRAHGDPRRVDRDRPRLVP